MVNRLTYFVLLQERIKMLISTHVVESAVADGMLTSLTTQQKELDRPFGQDIRISRGAGAPFDVSLFKN